MLLNFSKFKWLVLLLLLPITGMAANADGFLLQLKGPEVQTPSSPTSYGPVAKSDTLWSIAKATRPNARLNLYQTMAAIVALNPHAFLDGDINRMIDGSILKIPSAAQIRATDGALLQQALNQPVKKQPAKSTISAKTVTNTSNPVPVVRSVAGGKNNKLTQLQGELAESNEYLLVSSETNRRLKLQLESIHVELAALRQQIELDNQLRAELSALIKQQNEQLDLQQAQIDEVTNQAEIDETNNSKSWLIIGVAGVFILLSLIWLGLWLKNRHDQKMLAEDAAIFDADNAVDELSDYLTAENYTTSEHNDAEQVAAEGAEPVNTRDMQSPEGEADFNRQLPDEVQMTDGSETFADDIAVSEPVDVEITTSDPVMPEIIEQMPEFSATNIDDNSFSDIDLTLDDVHTSFDNDTITPDLSWREELDSDETTLADVDGLIPEQTAADADTPDMDNPLDAELAEIDDMLAQYRPDDQSIETEAFDTSSAAATTTESEQPSQAKSETIANQVTDMDEIDSLIAEAELTAKTAANTEVEEAVEDAERPQSYGQTVDEMLAELDNSELGNSELENIELDNAQEPDSKPQPAGKDNQLDDIEAMLAEFSPNAFSNDASEQAPIDQVAAKQEEFIDIDKLLNESAQASPGIEEEPYDKVKLDVGLDEYSHTLLDHNDVDIDDDSNSIGAQLDLARAYLEIEDKDGAKSILDPLTGTGNAAQQAEVSKLLSLL